METVASWVAPAATMIAAIMTAANLGARVTGSGFIVFTAGSLAWVTLGIVRGEQELLVTNAFLTLVNLAGIWRWLGRQARYEQGGESAVARSATHPHAPDLFALGSLAGRSVTAHTGETLGEVVEAMGRCGDGGVSYVVVRSGGVGGVGETLHAIGWGECRLTEDGIVTDLDAAALGSRPALPAADWPATPQEAGAHG